MNSKVQLTFQEKMAMDASDAAKTESSIFSNLQSDISKKSKKAVMFRAFSQGLVIRKNTDYPCLSL